MDSILKLVYDNWYYHNGEKINLPNGIHPKIVDEMLDTIREQNCKYIGALVKFESDFTNIPFSEASLSAYFKKKFPNNVISIDDVNQETTGILVYLIELRFTFSSLYTQWNFSKDGINYEYSFKDTISAPAMELLKSGKLKLFVEYTHDPLMDTHQVSAFEKYLKEMGIDPSNVVISSGNDFTEYYDDYPDSKLKFVCGDLLVTHQFAYDSYDYPRISDMGYISDIMREPDLDSTYYRKKRFLSFNRTMKNHRYVLAHYALKYNLLDNNIFSFINDLGCDADHMRRAIQNLAGHDSDVIENSIKIKNMLPYEIDTHGFPFSMKTGMQISNSKKEWYMDTYVHLTTETTFESKSIFFSEKTWRPILNLQPFVYIGNSHALKKLKDLGFKTFHPFIDESYDLESDPSKRINLIKEEILKLNNKSMQELHDWYYSITDILIHNQKHFMSFRDFDPFETPLNDLINFFKDETK